MRKENLPKMCDRTMSRSANLTSETLGKTILTGPYSTTHILSWELAQDVFCCQILKVSSISATTDSLRPPKIRPFIHKKIRFIPNAWFSKFIKKQKISEDKP